MDPFTLALLGGTALASGGLNYAGSRAAAGAQAGAAQQSGMLGLLAQQQAIANAERMAAQGAKAGREFYGKGTGDVREFYDKGRQDLEDYYGRGTRALEDYYGRGREDLLGQAQRGEDISREFYGQGVAAQEPYLTAGAGATNRLAALFGEGGDYTKQPSIDQIQMDPGYAWRMQQGQQALLNATRAGVGGANAGSGAAGKAFINFGQGAASQEYSNAYNRFMANRAAATQGLQNLAGTGAGAAGTVSNLAGSMGNALAANRFNVGTNLANAATTTGGNIAQGAFNTGANLAQGATTAGSNLGTLASNAGSTVAGAYTGAIPTIAALTSANPYGQAMENAAAARASGYVGGTTALGNALNSGMGNALAYNMMSNMYPSYANRGGPSGGGYVYGRPDASNFGAGFSPGFMGAPTYGAPSYSPPMPGSPNYGVFRD